MSNVKQFRYEWIWEKSLPTGFLDSNRRPLRGHENIIVFSKETAKYIPQKHLGKPYDIIKTAFKGESVTTDKKIKAAGHRVINGGDRFPKTILKFKVSKAGSHPTQKPVKLIEYLIKTYSNKGDIILDNCIGSGTTAIAAYLTDRNWIGIEKEQKYVDIANKRIKHICERPFFQ